MELTSGVDGTRAMLATTVLVLDDDELVARTVVRFLRANGFRVWQAICAAEARASPAADIGVFDIDLGSESGIDVARELVANANVGRALFYSGTLDPVLLRSARTVGPVVSKAAGARELLHQVVALAAGVCGRVEE
jgi:DNA-binding NarL/FixJ family response regulator